VSFAIRSAEGLPAIDGILTVRGETFGLVTTDSLWLPMSRVPARLREYLGSWVWVAGNPPSEPKLFGRIVQAP
jgi:hypothetical protein